MYCSSGSVFFFVKTKGIGMKRKMTTEITPIKTKGYHTFGCNQQDEKNKSSLLKFHLHKLKTILDRTYPLYTSMDESS